MVESCENTKVKVNSNLEELKNNLNDPSLNLSY